MFLSCSLGHLSVFDSYNPNQRSYEIPKFSKTKVMKSTPSKQDTSKISLRLESSYFLTQNAQIWGFGLKFEISRFKIGYMQNFVKNRKLILFGPKWQKMALCAQNFQRQMTN